jgi:hypothetical protein
MRNWDLYIRGLVLMFIFIIGALMFTPRGIQCIACGLSGTRLLGVIAVVLGVAGLATLRRSSPIAR